MCSSLRPHRAARGGTLGAPLRHDAVLYAGDAEYAELVGGFLRDGVAAGEPALASVPSAAIALLRATLGSDAAGVEFADMTWVGRNPARIIPFVRAWSDAQDAGPRRFVGEPIWPGRGRDATTEAWRHEALLNVAFARTDVHMLCPYDTVGLHPDVVAAAEETHSTVNCHGHTSASEAYADPLDVYAAGSAPLPDPPADTPALAITRDLALVRGFVAAHARAAGLDDDRVRDLVVATNEAATNTVLHGVAPRTVRMWRRAGELICDVVDRGWIRDPLVGRRQPDFERDHGRGLWLVNQLCDLVELRSGPGGTHLRIHMRLP